MKQPNQINIKVFGMYTSFASFPLPILVACVDWMRPLFLLFCTLPGLTLYYI